MFHRSKGRPDEAGPLYSEVGVAGSRGGKEGCPPATEGGVLWVRVILQLFTALCVLACFAGNADLLMFASKHLFCIKEGSPPPPFLGCIYTHPCPPTYSFLQHVMLPLYLQTLTQLHDNLGERHWMYSAALCSLAALHEARGEYTQVSQPSGGGGWQSVGQCSPGVLQAATNRTASRRRRARGGGGVGGWLSRWCA